MVDLNRVVLSSWEKWNECSVELMRLQEDMCQLGRMHFIAEEASSLGGSLPTLEFLPILASGPFSSFLMTLTFLWKSVTFSIDQGFTHRSSSPSSSPMYLVHTFGILQGYLSYHVCLLWSTTQLYSLELCCILAFNYFHFRCPYPFYVVVVTHV